LSKYIKLLHFKS